MKTRHLFSFLLVGILSVSAKGTTPQKTTPLFWPESRLIPIQVHSKDAFADGLEFTITEFANSLLPLYSPSMKQWNQVSKLTYRRSSVAFANNRNPNIKAGISIVKANDWLQELNIKNLARYTASLQNLYKNRFIPLNSENNFSPISGSGFLVGSPYNMVHYQVVSENDPNKITEIRDFITQIDDVLVILSFESPQSLANHNTNRALNLMESLSSLDDLE